MKNIFQFFVLIISISLASCGDDFFESTVAIDIPEHTPTLAVSGNLIAGDTIADFFVSSSKSIEDSERITAIENAAVRLFKNGNLLAEPTFDLSSKLYKANFAPGDLEPGANFRLEVAHPDFEDVSSEQTMPLPVKLDKVEFMPEGTIDEVGDVADEYILEFTDPGDQENYYMVRAFFENAYFNGIDTTVNIVEVDLSSRDPNVRAGFSDNYESAPIVSDATFNGKKFAMNMYSFWGYSEVESRKLKVYLLSLSRERYLYLLSLQSFYDSEDNPFAEPVTVTSNIENGQGTFGTQAIDSLVLRF